jgi:alpha-galactosidase
VYAGRRLLPVTICGKCLNKPGLSLTNKEVIAIDQDELGIAAYRIKMADSLELWVKPLKNNELAVCFLNRASHPQKLNIKWNDLDISNAEGQVSI